MVQKQSTKKHRRHRSRAEADQLAEEYEASGLTREAFRQQRDVPLKTLCPYVTRYRREHADIMQSPRFVQREVSAPARVSSPLTVLLPGGRRIEVNRRFHAGTLSQLIAALGQGLIMFGIGPATRIYLAAGTTDMRKGFEAYADWCGTGWPAIRRADLCSCSPMRSATD